METSKNYYESVMRDFGIYARGRSLEQYCRDEAIDFKWLEKAMEHYGVPAEEKKTRQNKRSTARTAAKTPDMIRLHYDPESDGTGTVNVATANKETEDCGTPKEGQEPAWTILSLVIKSPSGNEIELRASKTSAVTELLLKLEDHA